jgi:hypothetical protein
MMTAMLKYSVQQKSVLLLVNHRLYMKTMAYGPHGYMEHGIYGSFWQGMGYRLIDTTANLKYLNNQKVETYSNANTFGVCRCLIVAGFPRNFFQNAKKHN